MQRRMIFIYVVLIAVVAPAELVAHGGEDEQGVQKVTSETMAGAAPAAAHEEGDEHAEGEASPAEGSAHAAGSVESEEGHEAGESEAAGEENHAAAEGEAHTEAEAGAEEQSVERDLAEIRGEVETSSTMIVVKVIALAVALAGIGFVYRSRRSSRGTA